jgi:DNA polymerase-3 subunit alpha (Gram-positive type)
LKELGKFLSRFFADCEIKSETIKSSLIESVKIDRSSKKIYINIICESVLNEKDFEKEYILKNFLDSKNIIINQINNNNEIKQNINLINDDYGHNFNNVANQDEEYEENYIEDYIEIRKDKFLLPCVNLKTSKIICGKEIKNLIKIKDIKNSGNFSIWGDVFDIDSRVTKIGTILLFKITDYTGSISAKIYKKNNSKSICDAVLKLKNDDTILAEGNVSYDDFEKEFVISPVSLSFAEKIKVLDNAPQKRVELHLHTSMSAMDGIDSPEKVLNRAAEWGHEAIAITDHGVAQSYPDAMNALIKLREEGKNFKVIYGIENYFVNDSENTNAEANDSKLDSSFVCFDLETTGFSASDDRIIEIGAVKIKNLEMGEEFESFINPKRLIPSRITEITGITDEMVANAPSEAEVIERFIEFCGDSPVLVAHNAIFDVSFLKSALLRIGKDFHFVSIDTVLLCKSQINVIKNYKLDTIAEYFKLPKFNHHRACDDSRTLAMIFLKLIENADKNVDASSIGEIFSETDYKKSFTYHQTILVKNQIGLKNLYKLISDSHINYFYKKPRILKSELSKVREGLLIGSACESGEFFRAIVMGRPMEDLVDIAKFYDYLEIQPIDNNMFMVREGKVSGGREQLKEFNKKVVEIGEKLEIPVVATGDVHFIDPYESEFRKVLMLGQGYKDGMNQAPLYFRTTAEMLDEFSYLGEKKAFEVVVTNTKKIAAMIEDILPIPKGVYPPQIKGAEEQLTKIVKENTHKIYGEDLPEIVSERLERELESIVNHGYAVLYMAAQKLVSKSEKDGYLVGSRGSVGSSFVATMAGISEVNPLLPHYICKKCKNSEFVTDGSYGSGFDLPQKKCPKCKILYHRDGQDIPFETFLGFEGDKTPDIDLNFSGEYQTKAHKYTEEIFGKKNVFRAGTIGTIAERSGLWFVKKVMEENENIKWNRAEQRRLALGCAGVKRTTGQHPGGMVIVPDGMEIYDFCPVQKPANDQGSNSITTHFDFHSIHDTICKLDELGHDVPTIYKYLSDYTGIPVTEINMSDPKVMSLFNSTKELGVSPEEIDSKIGTFSLPEVGTFFVRQMLEEAKPKTFADLVQISGLSHGTDVWNGNARELIKNGTCTISQVIGTRDNIMTFLISKGISKKDAFNITEIVRKGKASAKLDEKYINLMRDHDVPEWYIESCKKIKYMFPKAHAAAYMISTLRFGWYKVYKPLEYYAAYFTVRGEDIDHSVVIGGRKKLCEKIKEIQDKGREASIKEQSSVASLQIINEAMARGIEFLPIDIYESETKTFKIENSKIRLPFVSFAGLGEAAAEGVVESRKKGKFISISDLRERSKLTKTVIELMKKTGILKGMQESNQVSFF